MANEQLQESLGYSVVMWTAHQIDQTRLENPKQLWLDPDRAVKVAASLVPYPFSRYPDSEPALQQGHVHRLSLLSFQT
jgi:hypothetical protein